MGNKAENLIKLLCLTDALCEFANDVAEQHNCRFEIKINKDKFKFDLPELVAEVNKYRQAILDDIENCPDSERSDEPLTDNSEPIFGEPVVPEPTTKKTSSDEITMSDFDDIRKDMPDNVKKIFDLVLPLAIIEEAKAQENAVEIVPKEKRIQAIEMHVILKLAQLATS